MPKTIFKSLLIIFLLTPTFVDAAITGTVFKDADADGVADAAEVGLPGAVVSAFDSAGVLVSQTASCGQFAVSIAADPPTIPAAINVPVCTVADFGDYTLTGLTVATDYRIEVSFTDPMIFSTVNGVDSVRFVTDGDTGVLFGANYPEDYCQNNPRIVAGCYVFVLPGTLPPHDPASTEPLTVSWPYDNRFTTATNAQVHTGSFDYDADYGDFGHIFGVSVHRPTRQVFFSAISAPTWDDGLLDSGGIYTSSYTGAGDAFVPGSGLPFVDLDDGTAAQLTDLSNQFPVTPGDLDRFGEQGLGGISFTDDGTTLWAINMGAGSLLEITTGNPAVIPTAADITETPITGANCTNGRFRPSAVVARRGNVFIGGVCDASTGTAADLKAVVLEYDGSTFTSRLDEDLDFNTNQIFPDTSFAYIPWAAGATSTTPQPVMTDLTFDDNGGMIIGLMPRIVYNAFSQTAGQILRANPDGTGNYILENAGVSGPFTTAAETAWAGSGFTPANPEPLPEGPGDDYFFENGIFSGAFQPPPFAPPTSATYHPVLFSAGITAVPGTGEIAAGFVDPLSINTFGVRYLDAEDGTTTAGLHFGGLKVAFVSDVDAICRSAPLEIGNRLWCDTDNFGVQDPGETGVNGVDVSFQCGVGNAVTVNTSGDGNYVFTDALYAAANAGAQIPRGASCTISIPTTGANGTAITSACNGVIPSPQNMGGADDNSDLRDSDGMLVGTSVEIPVTTGGSGNNTHALDQGFFGVNTDYGDNPDPTYATLSASNGAVHTVSPGLFLGACVDTEVDGLPNATAAGDDGAVGVTTLGNCATAGDDEDGVTDLQNLIVGNATASVDVTSTGTCLLDAWIDFNQNGDFTDAGEQIFTSQALAAGLNNDLSFAIPAGATVGDTFSRFRCSSAGGLASTGAAVDGEVEDYPVTILPDLMLGDFVWYDTDQNGQQDVGEPGVNGITVNLYNNAMCTGPVFATTSTANGGMPAADGFYQFSQLIAGPYCVEFTGLPLDHQFTTQNFGADATDSDADIVNGQVQNINLVADDPTIDAGIFLNGSIAGLTWCESPNNANTTYDPGDGDTVLPNIGVTLYADADCSDTVNGAEAGTAVSQDTANPAGTYLFSDLPVGPVGAAVCYVVEVNAVDPDLGNCDSGITPVTQGPDLDTAVPNVTDVNFGFELNLTLGDFVWYDTNQNGLQEGGEPGVNGITVELFNDATCSSQPIDFTSTVNGGIPAADGFYQFTGLAVGPYCVQFSNLPPNHQFTAPNAGADDIDSDVDTGTGQVQNINLVADDPTIDAGVFLNGSVAGLTWCESSTNPNSSYDVGDGDTVLTDIGVTLYEDTDCSNTVNGAEIGTAVSQDTANPAGTYLFSGLPVGPVGAAVCYVVEVDAADVDLGACDTGITPVTQGPDLDTTVPNVTDVNFGFDDNLGLGDFVWFDTNQNGQQDTGEPGVNGIAVNLYDNATCTAPSIENTVTANGGIPAADGYYFFGDLDPGDYCVEFTGLPIDYQFTIQNNGADATDSDADTGTGQVQNINLTDVDLTIDAGVFLNGSIAGLTWCESSTNSNTSYDIADGDTLLTDIGVTLYADADCSDTVNGAEAGTAVSQDTTNPGGTYLFDNLPVGPVGSAVCYVVEVDDNDVDLGVCDSAITATSQGPDLDTVTPNVTDVNFGFDDLLSLGDYVWYDNNQNGQQDADEPGVNGITVNLYDNASCTAPALSTAVTATGGSPAVDGYYNFASLDPGAYCVEFTGLPVDYVFTDQNIGGDDAVDSDANQATGQVININLTAIDETIDAGIYANNGQVSGLLYCDDSPENGSQDAGEEVSGVTVTLSRDLDCDNNADNVVGTMVTDGTGNFLFDNLPVALAPAPPNPQACYVLEYDNSDPLLSDCNQSVTPQTQVVTIDTSTPEAPPVTFVVISGVVLPPTPVPVNSWFTLFIMAVAVLLLYRRQMKIHQR